MIVREVRILVQYGMNVLKICKIALGQKDASLYLFPYARQGKYFCGLRSMAGGQTRDSFDFTTDIEEESVPKLSIHESGQVHIYAGKKRVGPLKIPTLRSFRGEHIASVALDTFDALPLFPEEPRSDGPERDITLGIEPEVDSGRIAIFVNGYEARFLGTPPPPITLALQRPSGNSPLYVGLKVLGQQPLGRDEVNSGTTVIAGWDPQRPVTESVEYLYVRGT